MPLKERDLIPASDPRVAQFGHPAPPWMVNYADLMTELVCFFVILYALSAALSKDVQTAKKQVEEAMKQEEIAGDVKMDKDGLHITLQEQGDNVFFQSGSADLSPRMMEILDKIGPSLKRLADEGHDIVVEGHTDNVPIRNARYDSNWELSTARATNVVRDLIGQQRFPARHLAAVGYGENRPVAENDTPESRARNRRVVFFVKNKPLRPKEAEDARKVKAARRPEDAVPPADGRADDGYEEFRPAEEPSAQEALPLPKPVYSGY